MADKSSFFLETANALEIRPNIGRYGLMPERSRTLLLLENGLIHSGLLPYGTHALYMPKGCYKVVTMRCRSRRMALSFVKDEYKTQRTGGSVCPLGIHIHTKNSWKLIPHRVGRMWGRLICVVSEACVYMCLKGSRKKRGAYNLFPHRKSKKRKEMIFRCFFSLSLDCIHFRRSYDNIRLR